MTELKALKSFKQGVDKQSGEEEIDQLQKEVHGLWDNNQQLEIPGFMSS